MNRLTLPLLLSILVLSTSFQIKNINHDLNIQTANQYAQYIQTLSGLATQTDLQNNPLLSQIVQQQRPSLLNPQSDIVLALVDQIKQNNQNLPSADDLKLLNELDTLISTFSLVNLADLDPETLLKNIEDIQKAGKIVHTLEVSPQLIQILTARRLEQVDSEQSSEESSVSVNQVHGETVHKQEDVKRVKAEKSNPTYILKFFFAFLFIIVSLGSLMAIANMQNRKDTLLYAKFIADVGAR